MPTAWWSCRTARRWSRARSREVFAAPAHPYTRMLLATEPRGRPAPVPTGAPEVCAADDLKVHFPIRRGLLRRTVGHVKAVDGVSARGAGGRDDRPGRRIRLRQDHDRPRPAAPGSTAQGAIRFEGQDIQALDRRRAAPAAPAHADRLPGPLSARSRPRLSAGEIIGEGLAVHEPGLSRAERDARGRRGAGGGRALARHDGPLPARVQRRPAPAHRHRPRPGAEAAPGRAGRADQRARRLASRRRSWSCCATCRRGTASPTCSSATTCAWCARWRTASSC